MSVAASLLLWSLRSCSVGEHGSEQSFTGHALSTLEIHVWQLLGVAVIGAWQLELEIVKHYIIYSFVLPCPNCCSLSCTSLALKPVWRAVCSSSFPGQLLGAFVTCCCALCNGLVGSTKLLLFLLSTFTKREGCNENYFLFLMSLPCYVML